jgi:hypothetical protein
MEFNLVEDSLSAELLDDRFAQPATGEIVFIDPRVEDYQSLIASVAPGASVVILDLLLDGVVQIGNFLAGRSNVSSVHIVSHGSSGSLQLGAARLSIDTLENMPAFYKAGGIR